MSPFNRREFVQSSALGGLVLGTGFGSFADFAKAQANDDEHFFIFIELRGGVHWILGPDGRDISQLPMDNPKICRPFKITDTPPTEEEYADLLEGGSQSQKRMDHGKFLLLPYVESPEVDYRKGQTSLGCDYILGFCGEALRPVADDIAVVRGVYMRGNFHGPDNANGEIFSGLNSTETPHVASILANMLTPKYGARLLDNLVFENSTFSIGSTSLAKAPIRLDAQSLGFIVGNADELGNEAAESRFAKARLLSEALAAGPTLSELHKKVFNTYVGAMKDAPKVREMLLRLKDDLSAVDASLDLDIQVKTAVTLMQAGLTRVVSLCLGAPNGRNQVDGFGLFDSHVGTYHNYSSDSTANTQRHQRNVQKGMTSIATLVKTLKETPFGTSGKTMWDVTTVVVGSEYGRPGNFSGDESSGGPNGGTSFGNGHYQWNNNYMLFGRGIKGGAWVGKNEQLRQMGHQVELASLDNPDPNALITTPVEYDFQPDEEGAPEADGQGMYVPKDLDYLSETKRPIMARDVIKTAMTAAGVGSRYNEAYQEDRVKSASVIKSMLR